MFRAFLIYVYLTSSIAFASSSDVFNEIKRAYPHIILRIDQNNLSVAASAEYDGQNMFVIINVGLLKSQRLTPDTLRMIACHEIGHLLAGDPRKNIPMDWTGPIAPDGLSYLSSEGQADYFAARTCFPKLVLGQDHSNLINIEKVTPTLKSKCAQREHSTANDYHLCLRSSVAGYDFLRLTYDFSISFDTPDDRITASLERDTYPGRQCRLDTFVAGALGNAPRPACWFRAP